MSTAAVPAPIVGMSGWARPAADNAVNTDERNDDSINDRELAAACVAGTAGAFETLVERHQRQLYHLCYRFVGNHEDASDLSQEAFLRAHRGMARFRGQAALSTWLFRIAVNVCLSRVSAKKPPTEEIEPDRHVDHRSPNPADLFGRQERAAVVKRAIAKLPPKQRATLILRAYHELPHHEIAEILGNSVGAVKANYFHALRNLKRLLDAESL